MTPDSTSSPERVVHGTCPHDCPDTCAMLITVKDGVATKVRGDPAHPTTQGVLCTKVSRYLERTYSPDRILYPMRRVGAKGPGQGSWERIGWDEALDIVAGKLKAIAAEDPQAILPYAYSGTLGLVHNFGMPRRFFHRLGASLPERVLCATAGRTGYNTVIGAQVGTDIVHFTEARLIVLWGTNPITSNLHLWTRIAEARRHGARVIAIDPYRSQSAEKADWHLAPLPGTDGALAFGLMHLLIRDGKLDRDYIDRHTLGFDALAERAAGFTPEVVAGITGLSVADIEQLATEYGAERRSAIRVNFGLQRHAGGGNAMRAIACLPALTGAWREVGGGVLMDVAGAHAVDLAKLDARHLLPDPPPRTVNMAQIGKALTELNDPPIKALFVYASNPVAIAPNNGLVRRGLLRPDLFTVVHEIFSTDTCDYADIVLPATTQLEQFDMHRPYGTLYTMLNEQAIAPLGEACSNAELFRRLAARMGFDEPCLRQTDEEIAFEAYDRSAPVNANLDFDTLRRQGWQRLDLPERYAPFAEGNFPTPSGKCEFESASAARQGWSAVPEFVAPRESAAADPQLAARFPFTLLTPPARHYLNSSFSSIESLVRDVGEPWVDIHANDAADRAIADGDRVRVFNDRGAFEVIARVGDKTRTGVLVAPSIWWLKKAGDGENVNAVTSDGLTDIGRGASYYDTAVQITRC
ncbi:molybdopterin oxidoreductase family protein [Xylophilus sp. GOD-11R]|uniref:molybdopterin-containing oxidoreductase family protein n=1 Tax=Xylophilus sp. GOD-11R TaxID=3089814 RepID=UPI00298C9272|nr:molybdopterin oxidoreductase family protein [Xylophilus sp. GOD-11R]WPB55040.1 molybdopterin oxidoreductase family protein [Xylophilus sp. GOD-11R]